MSRLDKQLNRPGEVLPRIGQLIEPVGYPNVFGNIGP